MWANNRTERKYRDPVSFYLLDTSEERDCDSPSIHRIGSRYFIQKPGVPGLTEYFGIQHLQAHGYNLTAAFQHMGFMDVSSLNRHLVNKFVNRLLTTRQTVSVQNQLSRDIYEVQNRSGTRGSSEESSSGLPRWVQGIMDTYNDVKGYLVEYTVYGAYVLVGTIIGVGITLWLLALIINGCCRKQDKSVVGEVFCTPCTLCKECCVCYAKRIKLCEPEPQAMVVPPQHAQPHTVVNIQPNAIQPPMMYPPAPQPPMMYPTAPQPPMSYPTAPPLVEEGYYYDPINRRYERRPN